MTYPWSSGEILTAADLNTLGLVRITSATLSSVTNSISNVFSSTYDAYRVVVTDLSNGSATTRAITLRFRTASDDTGANYFWSQYGFYSSTPFNSGAANATSAEIMAIADTTNDGGSFTIDIQNPNLAKATTYYGAAVGYQANITFYATRQIAGGVNTATQYTGFSIIGDTDNLSGTVRVYGYTKP